jgi:hypothetical protein
MDETPKKKSLSEISHLFLSSVRDNATGGTRPKRLPPGSHRIDRPSAPQEPNPNLSIDLTPEEYARVYGNNYGNNCGNKGIGLDANVDTNADAERPPVGPVSAVICPQFNGHQFDRVKEYARHLASGGERVGLIEVDAAECRLMCFELAGSESLEPAEPTQATESRQMAEALEELAWDIDRWILLLPSPRTPEARGLLKQVNQWVLLSTCDHDGVVSCYRAIKGLVDNRRPRLTLALLNAADQTEAGKVYRKIAGVCEQFLNWKMEAEPAVEPTDAVSEHLTLVYRPTRERTTIGAAAHWQVVTDFLARANEQNDVVELADQPTEIDPPTVVEQPTMKPTAPSSAETESRRVTEFVIPTAAQAVETVEPKVVRPVVETIQSAVAPAATSTDDDCDVTDLPAGEVTEAAVLAAIMRKPGTGLIECPIRPPACPEATLAVGRDRRLVLLAVARKGLTELRHIGQAYRWVIENRPLLSMAMPQLAIDTHALPSLRLIIDRADSQADLLLPMSENKNVTVHTYRKLRWAGKTGLLLEAA